MNLRQRIDNPLLEITLSLVTPYLTYVLAEGAHLSGVLATVAAGVYVGSHLSRIYAPGARLQAFAFLDVLVFLLNAVLFTLVGMELWRSLHWVPGMAAGRVVAVISAVVVVVIASRLVWMLSGPVTARLFGRVTGEPVWRERVVVAWAGMRGGLSLAAALAIPLRLADGRPFPDRDLVIVVAAAVIVTSLLIQGTSLPWLLRRLGLRAEDFETEENKARLKAARAALEWLDDPSHADAADEATKSVRSLYEAKVRRLELGPPSDEESDDAQEMERYRALRLRLLGVERSVLTGVEARRAHQRDTAAHYRTRPRPRRGETQRFLSVAGPTVPAPRISAADAAAGSSVAKADRSVRLTDGVAGSHSRRTSRATSTPTTHERECRAEHEQASPGLEDDEPEAGLADVLVSGYRRERG